MIAAVRDGKIRLNLEGANVAKITVRNISDDVLHALRLRASRHGKSVEDEARDILSCAVNAHSRVKLGSLLAEIGRKAKLSDDEFALFQRPRSEAALRSALR